MRVSPSHLLLPGVAHAAEDLEPEMANAIAETFITQYYQTFDTNRAALAALYVSAVV